MTDRGPIPPPWEAGPPPAPVAPHRATTVVVLGVLSIVFAWLCCVVGIVLGIISWVMGNRDLVEMDVGRMDDTGRGITQAGRVCGIIGVALAALTLIITVIAGLIGGFGGT